MKKYASEESKRSSMYGNPDETHIYRPRTDEEMTKVREMIFRAQAANPLPMKVVLASGTPMKTEEERAAEMDELMKLVLPRND